MLIKVSFTIFFFIKIVSCEETFKLLSHDKSLSGYKKYCVAKYENFSKPQGYVLEKVIVIHRHGDRTPIDFFKSKWEEENCCLCKFNSTQNSISDCKKTKCHNGDLTLKGFQQLKILGKFVSKSYPEQIKDIEIYVSRYPRTWGSVFGLINGIYKTDTIKNVKLAPEYSLYPVTNCENRINMLSSPTSNFYDSIKEENRETSPERISDNLFTHICNDIKINCNILTCDPSQIKKYIEANRKTWFEEMKIVEKNERIIKLDFGILAGKILELFQNDTKMHIFSAHDNTISSVLTGFGTGIFEKPSYASVIFIEKLSKNNSFFYRLLYNGKPMKTIITPENVILNENEFNEYLKLLTITREEITDLCADNT